MLASIKFKVLFVALKVNNEHNGKYILNALPNNKKVLHVFANVTGAVDIA